MKFKALRNDLGWFGETFTQRITVAKQIGDGETGDEFGNPTYATPYVIPRCAIRADTTQRSNVSSQFLTSQMPPPELPNVHILCNLYDIDPGDQIPDAGDMFTPEGYLLTVTEVDVKYDWNGPHHLSITAEFVRE